MGDSLKVVTSDDQLILLGLGSLAVDTLTHLDVEDDLLTQEVADFDGVALVVNDHVDRKVSIYVAHLVLEALGDTSDHVVDDGANGADSSNVLADAMVDNELELVLALELNFNVQVAKVLGQFAAGTLDGDNTGLDVNSNTLGDDEFVVLADILQHRHVNFA